VKHFVLVTNRTTAEQDKAFFTILRARFSHLGWWHQLSETWLFVDLMDTTTAEQLRNAAMEAFPTVFLVVLEITGQHTWAGFGPTESMFKWIRETWDRSN
jgi:hypothetical protein